MNRARIDSLVAILLFLVTFVAYALTAQRSTGFWDTGEFIAASYKLQVTHPPGAPLYTIFSRVVLSMFPAESVAFISSLISGLFGALTISFVYLTLVFVGRKFSNKLPPLAHHLAGIVGALSLAFCHSFWTASTEAEVYSMSTFFIAIIFWTGLKWTEKQDWKRLLLIALLSGMAASVHIMSLAVLIPLGLLIWIELKGLSLKNLLIGGVVGGLLFSASHNLLFKWPITIAEKLELFLVNSGGLPFHSGPILMVFLVTTILVVTLFILGKRSDPWPKVVVLSAMLYMIGLTPYAMVMVRSNVETPISNDGSDITRLMRYIETEQYVGFADRPFLKGKFYDSVLDKKRPYKDGKPAYVINRNTNEYELTNSMKRQLPNYPMKSQVLFSRMYSSEPRDKQAYTDWVNITGEELSFYNSNNEEVRSIKPDLSSNLSFFFKFQLGWLNLRYLLSNFAGVQNDFRGVGAGMYGNWISGIGFLDAPRIGDSENLPAYLKGNLSTNKFFLLPLLLGLIGLVFSYRLNKCLFWVLLASFMAFGLAISIFMNQVPNVIYIRERDYVFLGMYHAFSLFMGIGVLGLIGALQKILNPKIASISVGIIALLIAPASMAFQGWDDHDRTSSKLPEELAKAYLASCKPNSILITSGDNVTMPIWYAQEVLGYRTDVRVVDFQLLSLDWYVDRLKRRINDSAPLNLALHSMSYAHGRLSNTPLIDQNSLGLHIPVDQILGFVTDPANRIQQRKGKVNYLPTAHFKIPRSKHDSLDINWEYRKAVYHKSDLVLVDVLNSNINERSLAFVYTGNTEHFVGLQKHFVQRGLVFELTEPSKQIPDSFGHQVDLGASLNLLRSFDIAPLNKEHGHVSYIDASISEVIIRRMYANVANALNAEGYRNDALEVLEKCESILPNNTIHHTELSLPLAIGHIDAGETEYGAKMLGLVLSNIRSEIDFYLSFKPNHYWVTKREIQAKMQSYYNSLSAMSSKISKDFGQQKEAEFRNMVSDFDAWMNKHEPKHH